MRTFYLKAINSYSKVFLCVYQICFTDSSSVLSSPSPPPIICKVSILLTWTVTASQLSALCLISRPQTHLHWLPHYLCNPLSSPTFTLKERPSMILYFLPNSLQNTKQTLNVFYTLMPTLFFFFYCTPQHAESQFLAQGENPHLLRLKTWSLNQCTIREVPKLYVSFFFF